MQNNNFLVSIIIPTHNRSKYLIRSINSCINQTYQNIEIIIIDDYSSDDTRQIVDSIVDKRIKYYKNSSNKWPNYSRNKWVQLSGWEYINFLDDDDELLPEKIEMQLQKFKTSKIKNLWVITWDVEYKRSDINKIKKNRKSWNIYKDLLKSYCVYWTQQMLIKKQVFEKVSFDELLQSNQEYDLMIQISQYYNYDFLWTLVSIQNESENQISYNFKKKLCWTFYLYKKYKKDFKENKMFMYNFFRYHYLFFKYFVWLIFWKKIYLLLF